MAESYRIAYPESPAGYITPDSTGLPVLANPTINEAKISVQAAAKGYSSTDSHLAPKKIVGGQVTATGTINFAAAPDPRNASVSVDCSTYLLLWITFYAPPTNTALINIAPGASNPYPLFGTGNDIDIKPGQEITIKCYRKSDDTAPAVRPPAVSGTVKNVDITISGSDVLNWTAAFAND